MDNNPQIVPLDELARRLRLSRRWLWQEADAGRIPSLKAGRRRLFNPAAVEAALAGRAASLAPGKEAPDG
jgi:excisionase family DNA binding protein